jgi:hypothetical protein
VINCRHEGLAENFCKTHETLLVKRSKDRVRSEKGLDGAGLKRCHRSRVFSSKFARH